MLIFLYAIVSSWRSGKPAGPNPWHGKTLEWFVPSPPPLENFEVLPVVTGDPYGYGEPDTRHTTHEGVPVAVGGSTGDADREVQG